MLDEFQSPSDEKISNRCVLERERENNSFVNIWGNVCENNRIKNLCL